MATIGVGASAGLWGLGMATPIGILLAAVHLHSAAGNRGKLVSLPLPINAIKLCQAHRPPGTVIGDVGCHSPPAPLPTTPVAERPIALPL